MFKDTKAFSGFSVADTKKAKTFYGHTLGLQVKDGEMDTLAIHLAGGAEVIVYPKGEAHTPASFTILNFMVPNIEKAVDQLVAKGIQMERYPDMEADAKGIFRGAEQDMGPNIAWFKDPDGNVLSVIEQK